MILVDSSIWIDLFADRVTIQTERLHRLVAAEQDVCSGDLIVTEILQGARDDHHAEQLLRRLSKFGSVAIVGDRVAIEAARNYRALRTRGITVRKTIDVLIASRCILDDMPLLYSDRDFDPFVEHLGLIPALRDGSGVN